MNMLNTIRAHQVNVRKIAIEDPAHRWHASLLTTLIGEVELELTKLPPEQRTDAEIDKTTLAVVRRFVKRNEELPPEACTEVSKAERTVLNGYLPRQLSKGEILEVLRKEYHGAPSTGPIMKFLKDNYNGQYDGKDASEVARTFTS